MAAELGQQPKNNDGSAENAETDRHPAYPDADGIVAVDVKGLSGPEKQDGEKIGTGDKGDNKGEDKNPRVFLNASRKHRIFGAIHLPEPKGDEERNSYNERRENVCRPPRILIASG